MGGLDPHAGVELHRGYAECIEAERNRGRRDALESVARFRGDEEQSLLILYGGAVTGPQRGVGRSKKPCRLSVSRASRAACSARSGSSPL